MSISSRTRVHRSAARQALEASREVVRSHLRVAAEVLAGDGLPRASLDGKVLRPLAAYLTVPKSQRARLDRRFWMGALAVEMVHEASLLHDDILDDAPERRGRPTLFASAGAGPALVLGDHLLTSAYRAAASAGSSAFLEVFITSVERTVAGEIAQEKSQGKLLSGEDYRSIVTGKSGELFRSVLTLPSALLGLGSPETVGEMGARLGCFYQMVDDFLDYCTSANRGKAPLQDYRQEKWTWPLGLIGAADFETPEEEVLARLFRRTPAGGASPLEEGTRRMEEAAAALLDGLRGEGLEVDLMAELLRGWWDQLQAAATDEAARLSLPSRVTGSDQGSMEGAVGESVTSDELARELAAAASGLEGAEDWLAYFSKHAKSFRFASRLFPTQALRKVAGVYAFCRFTDDLVDEAPGIDAEAVSLRLSAWEERAAVAYRGGPSGIALLDAVMSEAREAGVPFHYVRDLVEGVRMDLSPRRYRSLDDLRSYSYRVASVVGGWLTQLFGIRDPDVLEGAYALGHTMQLTNILRDVGEDLRRGRLYLPEDRMSRHGVDRALVEAMAQAGGPVLPGYRALLEELMAEADAQYERAFRALPELPPFFRRPVAIAARVYQGIHDEIRRNDYDNLGRRARTSLPRKLWVGAAALLALAKLPVFRPQTTRSRSLSPTGVSAEARQEAAV